MYSYAGMCAFNILIAMLLIRLVGASTQQSETHCLTLTSILPQKKYTFIKEKENNSKKEMKYFGMAPRSGSTHSQI